MASVNAMRSWGPGNRGGVDRVGDDIFHLVGPCVRSAS